MTHPAGPFELLCTTATPPVADKARLLTVSQSIEARARAEAGSATMWVCVQAGRYFTGRTARVYADLIAHGVTLHLFGVGVEDLLPGAQCRSITGDDPLAREWNVLLLADGRGWAMTARERSAAGALVPDLDREFAWGTSADRGRIALAADSLTARFASSLTP